MQEVVNFFSWSSNEFFGQNIGEKLEYSHNGGACNGTGAAVGGDIFVECAELSLMPSRTQHISRCGSRILSRGGPQLLRPKVADVAKRGRVSKASP